MEWRGSGLIDPGQGAELRNELRLKVAALISMQLARKAKPGEKTVIELTHACGSLLVPQGIGLHPLRQIISGN